MFLKRDSELKQLKAFIDSSNTTAAMIYGIRQIGKSSLILKAIEGKENVLYFECLDAPVEENLAQLSRKMKSQLGLPSIAADDIIAFFENLKAFGKKLLIVLDEYQFLKRNSAAGNMDSYMQNAIDMLKGSGIKTILCGSYVTDMKELLERDNPLFNRFQLILHLKELDYYDASAFYPNLPSYDKTAFFSVFGGNPNALSLIDSSISLEENIKNLFLRDNAPLRFYIEYILFLELRKVQAANAVMDILRNSRFRFSEIEDRIKGVEEKNLARQLKVLMDIEAVEKVSPINARDDKRKTFYTITNNLVRFYYAYIYSFKDELMLLGPDTFYRMYIAPSISTFISYRAEGIARSYFSRMAKAGLLGDVYDIGTYWYDDKKRKRNREFDCVIKRRNSFDIYEVKYLSSALSEKLMEEEIGKIRAIDGIRIGRIGFVAFSGFEKEIDGIDEISGEELYRELQ